MAENQVTTMVIKVDLRCEKYAKKIKKVLCKIPQIQNQIYDKKANTVTVTVACCSPKKIKQKICCKGGETVKGIDIKVPEGNPTEKPTEYPEPIAEPAPPPVPQPASPEISTVRFSPPSCLECYEGWLADPCFHGYGTPVSPPCCDPPYGIPVYDSWGGGGCNCQRSGYYVCRCEYVCDDNLSSCPAAPPCCDPPDGRPVYDSWGGDGCNCQRSGYYVCRCEYVCDDNLSSCIIM